MRGGVHGLIDSMVVCYVSILMVLSNGNWKPIRIMCPKVLIRSHACHLLHPSASSFGDLYGPIPGEVFSSSLCWRLCSFRPLSVSFT